MNHIFAAEGGYVNDPDDPGGETNYGITKRFYPELDIKNLTKGEAKEIYMKDYYLPMNIDAFQDFSLALHLFDMGVNAGTKTAVKLLQGIGVMLKQDGIVGPKTIKWVNYSDKYKAAYPYVRADYYARISHKTNYKYLRGWLNRIDNANKFINQHQ